VSRQAAFAADRGYLLLPPPGPLWSWFLSPLPQPGRVSSGGCVSGGGVVAVVGVVVVGGADTVWVTGVDTGVVGVGACGGGVVVVVGGGDGAGVGFGVGFDGGDVPGRAGKATGCETSEVEGGGVL